VRTTEHIVNPASTPKTGPFAILCGPLGAGASSALSTRRAAVAIATFVLLLGALVSASAQAADIHDFLPGPSEEISKGVPAGAKAAGGEPAVTGPMGGEGYNAMISSPAEAPTESGHLWIAGPGRVDEFNASSGKWELQLEHLGSEYGYNEEYGVAVGGSTGERQVYVTDSDAVAVFGPTGKLQSKWTGADTPGGSFNGTPAGLAVDRSDSAFDEHQGDVYVGTSESYSQSTGSESSGVVDVFEPKAGGEERYVSQLTGTCPIEGTVVGAPTCEGRELIPFLNERERRVAVDPASGEVLVSNQYAVDVFRPLALGQYEFVRQITGIPDHRFEKPINSVVSGGGEGDGDIYIGEKEYNGPSVVVYQFSSEGVYEGSLTETPAGSFKHVTSVAVDPASGSEDPAGGDVYVSDAGSGGKVDVFGPDKVLPDVLSGVASQVTPYSAVLNGTVDPLKEGKVSCQFAWGVSEALGRMTQCEPEEVGEGDAPAEVHSEELKELRPDTTYYYHLQATNKNGTNIGEGFQTLTCDGKQSVAACFTTAGPGIESESVSDIASTSATFDASINPNGGSTSYYFEYGPTSGYGSLAPAAPGEAIGAGDSAATVSQHVQQGLTAGTVYHYRAVAVSEVPIEVAPHKFDVGVETFYGEDQTFETQAPGEFRLPDGREWEMVSPPQKQGALIEPYQEGGEITQAAAGGDAIAYLTNVPTELGVAGYTNEQQVLSRRGLGGWVTTDLADGHDRATGQTVEAGEEYRFFSEDLSQGIVQPLGLFLPCRSAEGVAQPCLSADASEQTAFVHTNFLDSNVDEPCTDSCFAPLVTGCPSEGRECAPGVKEHANVPAGTVFGEYGLGGAGAGNPCGHSVGGSSVAKFCGPYFDGANSDLSNVVINGPGGVEEWSAAAPPSEQLQPVGVLPRNENDEELPYAGELWLGSVGGGAERGPGSDERHAISSNGSRVFWSTRNSAKVNQAELYMRENADRPSSPSPVGQCTATAGACTIEIGGEGASFQDANTEGSRVFFSERESLYVCEIIETGGRLQCKMSDLASIDGGWVVGASEDGSYVYFATDCTEMEVESIDHKPCGGLYVAHESEGAWTSKFIASGAEEINGDELQAMTARVSPNGQWLAFVSDQDLTGYDTRDAASGQRDQEVYLYSAQTGRLACASCDPTGARPDGIEGNKVPILDGENLRGESEKNSPWLAAALPAWVEFYQGTGVYQPRYLSDNGRLFFDSEDALVPQDVNGTLDVYEYEPEGLGSETARCGPAKASGSDVFKPAHTFEVEGKTGEEGAGCVALISSGGSAQESAFMDASETGGDVFFMTTSRLVPQDFDTAYDIYDAHECTSASPCIASPPVAPPECMTAEACRAAPTPEPSIYGAPSSQTFSGLGNLTPTPAAPAVSKKIKARTVRCKKGFVKERGKCARRKGQKAKAKVQRSNRHRRAV
jgi:hypothetical protein